MLRIFENAIFFAFFKSSEANLINLADALVPERKCMLPNTWTEWIEHGTCESVTRIRSYKYYMCKYEI